MTTRCGTVALTGLPNVGKSSLLNAILGTNLAMVSPKAQASRLPVTGLHTERDTQMILQDLPGLLEPAYAMQRSMRHLALEALGKADVVLHLHPASDAPAPDLKALVPDAPPIHGKIIVVYTKADLTKTSSISKPISSLLSPLSPLPSPLSFSVSTSDPKSITELLGAVARLLPERPFQHDPDTIGTQPIRFFVGEYLREAAFNLLDEEVPYSMTAEVDEFREDPKPVYIRATLFVERNSQKGIVIGKRGAVLKQLGAHARIRLEELLGEKVYLETWVKVLPGWRKKPAALARFGFPVPDDEEK